MEPAAQSTPLSITLEERETTRKRSRKERQAGFACLSVIVFLIISFSSASHICDAVEQSPLRPWYLGDVLTTATCTTFNVSEFLSGLGPYASSPDLTITKWKSGDGCGSSSDQSLYPCEVWTRIELLQFESRHQDVVPDYNDVMGVWRLRDENSDSYLDADELGNATIEGLLLQYMCDYSLHPQPPDTVKTVRGLLYLAVMLCTAGVVVPPVVMLPLLSGLIFARIYLICAQRGFEARTVVNDHKIADLLREGTIRLLSADYICNMAESILLRHQELPEEAFVSKQQAVEYLLCGERCVGVLSYRWLTAEHPDPEGYTRKAVAKHLERNPTLKAIFVDFCSIAQKPPGGERTKEEALAFKKALGCMGNFYASLRTVVLQRKTIQPGYPDAAARPYDASGWCRFEDAAARLVVAHVNEKQALLNAVASWIEVLWLRILTCVFVALLSPILLLLCCVTTSGGGSALGNGLNKLKCDWYDRVVRERLCFRAAPILAPKLMNIDEQDEADEQTSAISTDPDASRLPRWYETICCYQPEFATFESPSLILSTVATAYEKGEANQPGGAKFIGKADREAVMKMLYEFEDLLGSSTSCINSQNTTARDGQQRAETQSHVESTQLTTTQTV